MSQSISPHYPMDDGKPRCHICIDNRLVAVPVMPISRRVVPVTGRELKRLAGIDADAGLFLTGIVKAHAVQDDELVQIMPGDRLFSVQAAVNGANKLGHT